MGLFRFGGLCAGSSSRNTSGSRIETAIKRKHSCLPKLGKHEHFQLNSRNTINAASFLTSEGGYSVKGNRQGSLSRSINPPAGDSDPNGICGTQKRDTPDGVSLFWEHPNTIDVTVRWGNILPAERPYPASDCVSHKPLWAAEAGLLAAGQSPGFEICNSGFGLRLKRHPLPLAERVFSL